MQLSQSQLRAFSEVAKCGSFTKAAQLLGLTQSALSHRIKNLESELATTLLIRDPAGIRLTDAGERLLAFCRVQSELESELVQNLRKPSSNDLQGFLRIGAVSTVVWSVVIPALGDLLRENPQVHLEVISDEVRNLPKLLRSGQVDFIVTCGKQNLVHCEELHLGDEQNVLINPKIASLRTGVYLDHDSEDRTTHDFFELQKAQPKVLNRTYLDDIYGIIAGVEEGIGSAVVPLHLLNGRKVKVVSGNKVLSVPIFLYYPKQAYYPKLHSEVVATLKTEFSKVLNQIKR